MLANGITLEVQRKGESVYKKLPGLKEVPEIGVEPEKVDNTTLEDTVKQSELGIGDPGEMEYKFKYTNDGADCSYRVLRELAESKEVASYRETLPDGTKFEFDAQSNVKIGGGGVNAAIEISLALGLQSDIEVTDPS